MGQPPICSTPHCTSQFCMQKQNAAQMTQPNSNHPINSVNSEPSLGVKNQNTTNIKEEESERTKTIKDVERRVAHLERRRHKEETEALKKEIKHLK